MRKLDDDLIVNEIKMTIKKDYIVGYDTETGKIKTGDVIIDSSYLTDYIICNCEISNCFKSSRPEDISQKLVRLLWSFPRVMDYEENYWILNFIEKDKLKERKEMLKKLLQDMEDTNADEEKGTARVYVAGGWHSDSN